MTMDKDNIELPPLPGEYYSFSKGEVHEYGRECYEAGLADERERREAAERALRTIRKATYICTNNLRDWRDCVLEVQRVADAVMKD